MIKLFVGLGNPGPEYEATRHNAGAWWIDALAQQLKVHLVMDRSYHGFVARTTIDGQTIWLLQPQTFMNLSGKSVAALARFFKTLSYSRHYDCLTFRRIQQKWLQSNLCS